MRSADLLVHGDGKVRPCGPIGASIEVSSLPGGSLSRRRGQNAVVHQRPQHLPGLLHRNGGADQRESCGHDTGGPVCPPRVRFRGEGELTIV